jgi:predicted pyridoxine 5'-phosphate oxidase superfamily flavin-nucleotide-binding protein
MNDAVDNVAALEACIGKAPGAIHLKVIDHLDAGALRWIASSTLIFAGCGGGDDSDGSVDVTLGGGEPGFARAIDPARLRLPLASLDRPQLLRAGCGFGALFLSPGIGETLRVNGRVVLVDDNEIEIAVDECYVHCAKALLRSNFWSAAPLSSDVPPGAEAFLAASRFVALATMDAQGRCDLSPKGDPAGAMVRLQDGCVWYADRPGNRRADSFRNILAQPRIAAVALIPGSSQVAVFSGSACITSDAAMRAGFTVEGKTPLLATCVEQLALDIYASPALARARLWPVAMRAADIDPAAMLVAHVKGNKTRGLQAALVRTALSVPGLMEKGLQSDYKNNLY